MSDIRNGRKYVLDYTDPEGIHVAIYQVIETGKWFHECPHFKSGPFDTEDQARLAYRRYGDWLAAMDGN